MKKEKRLNKTEQVVDLILDYMITNKLRVGDKLPSEQEMTELFGVSRLCVREALRGLKFMGVVEAGTRRGTSVKEVDFSSLGRALSFQMASSNLSYQQLLEARLLLELGALDVIGASATTEQFDELEKYAGAIGEVNDMRSVLQKDSEFHRKLMSVAGNEVLGAFARLIEMFFCIDPEFLLNHKVELKDNAEVAKEHLMIVRALRNKNFDLARGLMRHHLQKWDRK